MRIAVSFGIDKSEEMQNLILFGVQWLCHNGILEWIEIYLFGFRFFFAWED